MRANLPVAPIGVPGQTLQVKFYAVGFDRDARTQQPSISLETKILDANGKPTLAKPMTQEVKPNVAAGTVAIPLSFPLDLNRAGKFTLEITAVDQVSKKTSKLSLPITVIDPNESR